MLNKGLHSERQVESRKSKGKSRKAEGRKQKSEVRSSVILNLFQDLRRDEKGSPADCHPENALSFRRVDEEKSVAWFHLRQTVRQLVRHPELVSGSRVAPFDPLCISPQGGKLLPFGEMERGHVLSAHSSVYPKNKIAYGKNQTEFEKESLALTMPDLSSFLHLSEGEYRRLSVANAGGEGVNLSQVQTNRRLLVLPPWGELEGVSKLTILTRQLTDDRITIMNLNLTQNTTSFCPPLGGMSAGQGGQTSKNIFLLHARTQCNERQTIY